MGEHVVGLLECKPTNVQNLLCLNTNVLIRHLLHVLGITAHHQGVHTKLVACLFTYLLTYILTYLNTYLLTYLLYLLHRAESIVRS